MWELDHKESWAPKNWCFWTVVLEKTLENSLDCKEIQPVHPQGDQSWVFIGRTDAEAETPILWPPLAKRWLIGKDPDAGKDWEDDRRWDGWVVSPTQWTWVWVDTRSWWWQGCLVCCGSWGHNELDTPEWLNWTELNWTRLIFATFPICINLFNFYFIVWFRITVYDSADCVPHKSRATTYVVICMISVIVNDSCGMEEFYFIILILHDYSLYWFIHFWMLLKQHSSYDESIRY